MDAIVLYVKERYPIYRGPQSFSSRMESGKYERNLYLLLGKVKLITWNILRFLQVISKI